VQRVWKGTSKLRVLGVIEDHMILDCFMFLEDRFYNTNLKRAYLVFEAFNDVRNKVNLFDPVYRIPEFIAQKRCLSLYCFLKKNGNHVFQDDNYNLVPIKIQVPVLFRDTSLGTFREKLQEVVVGCTCVRPLY